MGDLLALAAELVAVPSVSLGEGPLADLVEQRCRAVPGLEVERVGANVVARTTLGRDRRVVLAGHLDTVPPAGNSVARVEGDTLFGLGAADMKGGLAVILELAESLSEPELDVTYVFYAGEEVSRARNGLLQMAAEAPRLLEGDVAVLGEPTACRVEAGCQGVVRAEVELVGRRAHTARPWTGLNAIHRLAAVLERVASYRGREPVIDGCAYREALQAVGVSGGVAGNVVPDAARLTLNHRFAPDRDVAAATAALVAFLSPELDDGLGDRLGILEAQPAAPPALSDPLLSALVAAAGQPPAAKLGWTDVAFFAERGIPAANFGPGDPELAHTAGERVERAALQRAYEVLRGLLAPTGAAGR